MLYTHETTVIQYCKSTILQLKKKSQKKKRMSILPNIIYRFNAIAIKILAGFLGRL